MTVKKYFMISLHERMLPTSAGVEPATLVSSRTAHPTEPPRPAIKELDNKTPKAYKMETGPEKMSDGAQLRYH